MKTRTKVIIGIVAGLTLIGACTDSKDKKDEPKVTTTTAKPVTTTTAKPVTNTVNAGSFCSPAGATGVTSTGLPMTCKPSDSDSRNRWRAS
jgi:hypothetical protein